MFLPALLSHLLTTSPGLTTPPGTCSTRVNRGRQRFSCLAPDCAGSVHSHTLCDAGRGFGRLSRRVFLPVSSKGERDEPLFRNGLKTMPSAPPGSAPSPQCLTHPQRPFALPGDVKVVPPRHNSRGLMSLVSPPAAGRPNPQRRGGDGLMQCPGSGWPSFLISNPSGWSGAELSHTPETSHCPRSAPSGMRS